MEDIFIKYLTGNITAQEKAELFEWMDASDANRKEYLTMRKVWDMYQLNSEPVEPSISFGQILAEYNRKLAENNTQTKSIKLYFHLRELLKIASVFILAFGLGWYFYANRPQTIAYHTIEVPTGQRVKLTLADGSLVWLNAQTKFTYPETFDKHHRRVTLDGEGLFEISHDAKRPFSVQTANYNVSVLGTKFEVYAYSNSNAFETILIEGSVEVSGNETGNLLCRMQPGQKLWFDEESQNMKLAKVNTNEYITWTYGIYSFNDITFSEMSKRLEHYYKTQIIISDSLIGNYHCTGKFRQHESITDIMNVVKSDMPFSYTYDKENNQLIINKKRRK
jgi:ferric-dicitrate binding protein FerR (iron transport regulator)